MKTFLLVLTVVVAAIVLMMTMSRSQRRKVWGAVRRYGPIPVVVAIALFALFAIFSAVDLKLF